MNTATAKRIAARANEAKFLAKVARDAHDYEMALDARPQWVRDATTTNDTRVPVSAKVEHDGLAVDSWTSKSGKEMHRVHWLDGTSTEYCGALDRCYVAWDSNGVNADEPAATEAPNDFAWVGAGEWVCPEYVDAAGHRVERRHGDEYELFGVEIDGEDCVLTVHAETYAQAGERATKLLRRIESGWRAVNW